MGDTPGQRFRAAIAAQLPLPIVGTINAYCALMAERLGHRALYLSGAACANMSHGLPDLGITQLPDVLEDARRITAVTELPLLVDIDTGWGEAFGIARTIRSMERAGVAAVHIEDQNAQKRCGHRPNKRIVSCEEMCDRIKAAVDARRDASFFLMARTDAYSNEGLDAAIQRIGAYLEAGADGIFAEAMTSLEEYRAIKKVHAAPLLANMTEFGLTPLFHRQQLHSVGVDMVLYPLSAARAMNRAAEQVYRNILANGDQNADLSAMQTREELYEYLNYHSYETKLDALFGKN